MAGKEGTIITKNIDMKLRNLSKAEMRNIEGGGRGFWYDVSYVVGRTSKVLARVVSAFGVENPGANGYSGCKF